MRTVPPFLALRVAVTQLLLLGLFLFLALKTVYNLFNLCYYNVYKKGWYRYEDEN